MNKFTESILQEATSRDKSIFLNYISEYADNSVLSDLKSLFPFSGDNSFYVLDVNSEWDISNTKNNSMRWKVYFPINDVYTKVLEIENKDNKRFTLLMYDGIIYAFDSQTGFLVTDVNALKYKERMSFNTNGFTHAFCGIVTQNIMTESDIVRKLNQIGDIYSIPSQLIRNIIKEKLNIKYTDVISLYPYRDINEDEEKPINKFLNTNHFTYKPLLSKDNYTEINDLFIKHTEKEDENSLVSLHQYYQGTFLMIGGYCFTSEEELRKIKLMRRIILLYQNSHFGK